MIVLAINTAGPACDVAVLKGKEVLAERREAMLRGQDGRLPALVEAVLDDASVALEQIDRYAVVTGPGSFTGIRVGVAFARGLSLATSKPCVGVTSLEASLPAGQQGSAIVALPAQKRAPDITYWTQTFRTGEATGAPVEMALDDLTRLITERPLTLFDDAGSLRPHFPAITLHSASPSAANAGLVAARLDPEGRTARPTYVRAPDAALPSQKSTS